MHCHPRRRAVKSSSSPNHIIVNTQVRHAVSVTHSPNQHSTQDCERYITSFTTDYAERGPLCVPRHNFRNVKRVILARPLASSFILTWSRSGSTVKIIVHGTGPQMGKITEGKYFRLCMHIATGDSRLKSRYEFETVNKLTAACIFCVCRVRGKVVSVILSDGFLVGFWSRITLLTKIENTLQCPVSSPGCT